MFNPNRKQKMETEPITYPKEPMAMSSAKSIQKIISNLKVNLNKPVLLYQKHEKSFR